MKTKPSTWFNSNTGKEMFGIKVFHPSHGWINAGDDAGIFMFESEPKRDTKRAELRKIKFK